MHPAYARTKRCLDLVFAAAGLCVLALPMAGCALAIKLTSRGPVLLRQTRIGKDGIPFLCCKFRTMSIDAPLCAAARLANPHRYVTPIGRFLRRYSFDETAQLLNVLRGDMSLIGPRPLIPDEREIHRLRTQTGVYALRPGMSGLSQIRGRDTMSAVSKAAWDQAYTACASFSLDAAIFTRTLHCIRH